jgi:hypothetical protein
VIASRTNAFWPGLNWTSMMLGYRQPRGRCQGL